MGKRVYTYTELSKLIDEDYSWRRKELHIITNLIPAAKGPKQNAALRSAVPILYAHWEGFVKKCCELYLEYVAGKHLTHNLLQPQFIALSLSKKFGNVEIKNLEQRTEHINYLVEKMDKQSNILTKNVILTKSNLRFSVFREILYAINIDIEKFKHHEGLINDLVDSRNNIAHGDYLKVDHDTFKIMYHDTQTIMANLKAEVENSAIMELYKK